MASTQSPGSPEGYPHNPADRQAQAGPTLAGEDSSRQPPLPFPVVGIGASAGGLEAVTHLLRHLSPAPGMAFVLVQHLEPHTTSILAELLARESPLPVREAADGLAVERDHLYIIPPNTNLALEQGVLRLTPRGGPPGPHMPIDYFLRSLAWEQESQAIGVLLSGDGSDGTLGLVEIKAEGGITFAQDDSARNQSMARSAIAEGCVDNVLPPDEIARQLGRIGNHPYVTQPHKTDELIPARSAGLNTLFGLVRNVSGVDFSHYKPSTIKRRIQRRMALHGIKDFNRFVRLLQEDPSAVQLLYQDLLIRVTSFFRDPEVFDALRAVVFPRLMKDRSPSTPMRIWVAGCSSGEEVYSVAICLMEFLGDMAGNTPIKILATDISERALEKARAGTYVENIELDVSPDRLRRFFTKGDGYYQICKPIRDLCVFSRHNLLRDPPFSHMDLVTCRNVLIYLSSALQRKVLPLFHYALNPNGFLLLGKSEGVGTFSDLFAPEDDKHKIFTRKMTPRSAHLDFQFPGPTAEKKAASEPAGDRGEAIAGGIDVQREADRALVARYAPPGILIDANLTILQFRGQTSPYLAPASGTASLELMRMVHEDLRADLRAAIAHARKENVPVQKGGLQVRDNGQVRQVMVEVLPVRIPPSGLRCFWLLFSEGHAEETRTADASLAGGPASAAVRSTGREAGPGGPRPEDSRGRLQEMQQDLDATRAYLQSLIEEQESTTEELKSANEEVLSSNEELQSLNEELQTAQEEMQSANEELTTLNDELKHRNLELGKVNDDLINLLGGVNIAIVMVSRDLRIRRFTPQAGALLNLIPTDVGRPLTDIRPNLIPTDLEQLITQVIETLIPQDREVRDKGGRWYALRVRPYITLENKIDGATIAAVDIDVLKRKTEKEIEQAQLLAREQTARADAEFASRIKDEFLAMLAHELRNPLTPILTSLDVLRQHVPPDPAITRVLDIATRQTQHMGRILDDLLDVSRITQGKIRLRKEPLDLAVLLRQVIESVQPVAEAAGLQVDLHVSSEPILLEADPTRFRQIMSNLLNNAIKFTPKGGHVGVTAEKEGQELVLRMRDNGMGIAPEMLPHVFDLFAQADRSLDRSRGGLGIGLTLVRRLVELHDGTVQAFSGGIGQGSAVVVRLPLAAAEPRPEAAEPQPKPAGGGRRVLIVDDNPDVAEALAMLLDGLGCEIRQAHSGREALTAARAFRPAVVLLDIGLPEMDGYEVARRLRQDLGLNGALLIAITGYGQEEDRRRAQEAGFNAHLVKPVSSADLRQVLAQLPAP